MKQQIVSMCEVIFHAVQPHCCRTVLRHPVLETFGSGTALKVQSTDNSWELQKS